MPETTQGEVDCVTPIGPEIVAATVGGFATIAAAMAAADGGVNVVTVAEGRDTFSEPPETVASSVGDVGSAITMVSRTTVFNPTTSETASRFMPAPGVTGMIAGVGMSLYL